MLTWPRDRWECSSPLDFESERKRRARFGPLPKPPEDVEVPYDKRHHDDFDPGEEIAWMMSSPEW